jgi:xylulokinase
VTGRPPAVLAIDLGTTSAKAGLVGLDGGLIASASAPAGPVTGDATGRAEQDPEAWWTAVVAVVRELVARDAADVVAIAADGHGPTLTAVDADGRPTRAAITWLDTRSTGELGELAAATGLRGWALGVLPAALWVARNEPTTAARTTWYLNTWEFLALRLSGSAATTVVAGQQLPSSDTLAGAGLDAARVAPQVAAGSVIDGLTAPAAKDLGLRPGIPVVAGVVDAFASFHGAGLLGPGDAIDTGGASGGFGVYWDQPIQAAGSFCTPAPLDGLYIVGGAMAATGRALDWFVDDVLGGAIPLATILEQAAATPPGADGLVFLPYLAGERSPLWDPEARGAFVGLTVRHGRAHMARAILEAAALAIRHVAAPILAAGVTVNEMRLCGGPARSAAWNRIKADVTGFTVAVPHVLEAAVVGSAILAATGIGAYPDTRAAIAAMTRVDNRLEPNPDLGGLYDALFETYISIHPAIRAIVPAA